MTTTTLTPSAHTPEPWKVSNPFGLGSNLAITAQGRGLVCTIENQFTSNHSDIAPEESEANARLIAAAPDLLAALRVAESALRQGRMNQTDGSSAAHDFDWVLAVVHDAIARATHPTS